MVCVLIQRNLLAVEKCHLKICTASISRSREIKVKKKAKLVAKQRVGLLIMSRVKLVVPVRS